MPSETSGQSGCTNMAYREYVNLVSDDDNEFIDDDDEPQLSQAIAASLEEASTVLENKSSLDLVYSLQHENLHADSEDPVTITIQRKSILPSTLRAINRTSFSFFQRVCINFSGEDAIDGGGPKREYFRLLMKSIQEMGIFEGCWFSHDLSLLGDDKYALAGKLVAWSILQGGPGPRCMSDEGYNILCEKPYSCDGAIEDVSEQHLKVLLRDIKNCTSEENFTAVVDKYGDEISFHGFSRIYLSKLSNKDDILKCLLRQYFVFRVYAEVDQFFCGLNHIAGIGAMVKKHPSLFLTFLSAKVESIKLCQFKMLCNFSWSPEGSNARTREDSTVYCWEIFLQDAEENQSDITLQDVLVFITGADNIPALGFPKPIDIHFYDNDLANNCRRRPWTSTCALTLNLPRGIEDPDELSNLMKECILNSPGFGKL